MGKYTVLLILIALMFNYFGCNSEEIVTTSNKIQVVGSGPVDSMTVSLPTFHSITNIATFDINVTKGSPQRVVLRAQQNILNVMTYTVVNGELILGFQDNVNVTTSEEVSADITVAEINNATIVGAGNYTLNGAQQNRLGFYITGVGNVESYNLAVDTCNIVITGVGNCRVRVNSLLNVTITGVGNVYYKGNPTIISTITGTGSIINDN